MNQPLLAFENVSYRFPGAKAHAYAIKDISFEVGGGEFVSLLGPSGAGKSTILRLAAGVIGETHGSVTRNFKKPAMIFQGHGIFPWLTVFENTAFGLHMEGVPAREREKIAKEKLEEVGLQGLESR